MSRGIHGNIYKSFDDKYDAISEVRERREIEQHRGNRKSWHVESANGKYYVTWKIR